MNIQNLIDYLYPSALPVSMSLFGYGALMTGFLVMLKRMDKAGICYFLFSLMVGFWGIGISFQLNNELAPSVAMNWGFFAQLFGWLTPVFWFQFVLIYTKTFKKFKILLLGIYSCTFGLFPFLFKGDFVKGFHSLVEIKYYPIAGFFYHFSTVLFFSVALLSFYLFYTIWRNEVCPQRRKENKILFFTTLYAFLLGGLTYLPIYGIPLRQYNLLLIPIWPYVFAFALVKYRLMEVEEIVQIFQKDKLATMGILAASINHEVRNPLYVISGMAEGYLEREKDGLFKSDEEKQSKAKEVLESAIQQSRRAVEIIKRFALFAKEGVKEEMTLEQVPLAEVMEDVLPLVRHELELDRIELIREIPQDLPPLYADRHHLVQIFFNLIVNACQAMKTGGKLIIRGEKTKDGVRVTVEDNGPGMTQEYLAQIFEPFRTTKAEGTGLGLYITKLLVEKNSAHITVESDLGRGTKFILNFQIQ